MCATPRWGLWNGLPRLELLAEFETNQLAGFVAGLVKQSRTALGTIIKQGEILHQKHNPALNLKLEDVLRVSGQSN